MDLSQKDFVLIGSLPLDTAEANMRAVGAAFGPHVVSIPDGEAWDRRMWIGALAWRALFNHPAIETVNGPKCVNGVEAVFPGGLQEMWQFRLKPGVSELRWAPTGWRLGYAKDAVNGYSIFKALQREGVIARDVRFQVSMPGVDSAIEAFFHDAGDWEVVKKGYEQAMRDEIACMLRYIPASDLLIQYDACFELIDVESPLAYAPPGDVQDSVARHVGPARRVFGALPEEVGIGFHLCYGIFGRWPMGTVYKDMSRMVTLANAFATGIGRRVDYVHLPVAPDASSVTTAPLADLRVGSTKVFFGIVHGHETSGAVDLRERIALLKKVHSDFGIARYCGFGGVTPEDFPATLQDHLMARRLLRE